MGWSGIGQLLQDFLIYQSLTLTSHNFFILFIFSFVNKHQNVGRWPYKGGNDLFSASAATINEGWDNAAEPLYIKVTFQMEIEDI